MGGTSQATAFVSALATIAQQMSVAAIGRRLSLAEFKTLLASSSNWLVDGDDENDNVINTGVSFPRVNALRLAERISSLDPSASPVPGDTQGGGTDGGSSPIPSTLSLSHTINLLAGQDVLTVPSTAAKIEAQIVAQIEVHVESQIESHIETQIESHIEAQIDSHIEKKKVPTQRRNKSQSQ